MAGEGRSNRSLRGLKAIALDRLIFGLRKEYF
jgi:hypothetical protein